MARRSLARSSLLSATMFRGNLDLEDKKKVNLKMLKLFCFSKLGAEIFRIFLLDSNLFISGVFLCWWALSEPASDGNYPVVPANYKVLPTVIIFKISNSNYYLWGPKSYYRDLSWYPTGDESTKKDPGNERFRSRQKIPENLSSQL